LTDVVTEDLSNVDTAQLERWAYGRAATPADQERAALAAAELQRRAALDRERAQRAGTALAVANGEGGNAAREHPAPLTDTERRHRRRMLATGISGLVAAALALSAGVVVLSNPSPLAIFERPESDRDREWARILALDPDSTFTAGPRVFRDEDGLVGIVARVSTVPDGRSTTWDAYCLYIGYESGDGSWSLSSSCTYPELFETRGLSLVERPSLDGDGYDIAMWGPIGAPRLERNEPLPDDESATTILDALAWPLFGSDEERDSMSVVDGADRLLMGPRLAFAAPIIAGDELTVHHYLLEGLLDAADPDLCVHVAHPESEGASTCIPLSVYRDSGANGIFVELVIAGQNWIVSVDATGVVRAQESQGSTPG
jgi:hypothetical protein